MIREHRGPYCNIAATSDIRTGAETTMEIRRTKHGWLRTLTAKEERDLLDRQARRYLKMSGDEFMRRYKAGEFLNIDTPQVMRVVMLLPFAR